MPWFHGRSPSPTPRFAMLDPISGSPRLFGVARREGVNGAKTPTLDGAEPAQDYHDFLYAALGGNAVARPTHPSAILDVGCGCGRWAREVAREYPSARVVGADLLPPGGHQQIGASGVPAPWTFVQSDILTGLPFADATFDYVHQRLLHGYIPLDRWPAVVCELVRVTRPGGWVELVEGGSVIGGGPALESVMSWTRLAARGLGIDLLARELLGSRMQAAGLSDVQTMATFVRLPPSVAARVLTSVAGQVFLPYGGLRGILLAQKLVPPVIVDATLLAARAELTARGCEWQVFAATGRKPL